MLVLGAAVGIYALANICDAAYEYKAMGRRDPFVPLVGIAAKAMGTGLAAVIDINDVLLQGMVVGQDGDKRAVLNGEMLKQGETVGSVTVKSIGDNEVIIILNDREYVLKLFAEK